MRRTSFGTQALTLALAALSVLAFDIIAGQLLGDDVADSLLATAPFAIAAILWRTAGLPIRAILAWLVPLALVGLIGYGSGGLPGLATYTACFAALIVLTIVQPVTAWWVRLWQR